MFISICCKKLIKLIFYCYWCFFADEIPGDLSSFPHEEKTVQLSTLDDAKDIYPPVYHGEYQ